MNDTTLNAWTELLSEPGFPPDWLDRVKEAFADLFKPAGRYYDAGLKDTALRSPEIAADNVPFAAMIQSQNAASGPYGGMSIAIFPVEKERPLLTFVVGTGGLDPDDGILGRPGHGRKVQAICSWLNATYGNGSLVAWAKQDVTRVDLELPKTIQSQFSDHQGAFGKYGSVIYGLFAGTNNADANRAAIAAFFDLYFEERLTKVRSGRPEADRQQVRGAWASHLMHDLSQDTVVSLLRSRRYVVIEGPPGTGKTRLATHLLKDVYGDKGTSIQFHPNTTYEAFVGGLAPRHDSSGLGLNFAPAPGFLMKAAREASADPSRNYLLHIDEINRADLAKVLGEAIYLFEPNDSREIDLSLDFGEGYGTKLSLPDNLHVLGTMNTADRSLAVVDVAVRRRFAFAKLWPQAAVVRERDNDTMNKAFDALVDIFIEHASDDALNLVPGHSYFLPTAGLPPERQLQVTLKPLLEEYLAQGYVGGFAEPIRAYIQWLDSL
jgi:5-methylcytosine-specific restriction protein B